MKFYKLLIIFLCILFLNHSCAKTLASGKNEIINFYLPSRKEILVID